MDQKELGDPLAFPFIGVRGQPGLQLSVERLDLVTKVTASITRIASAGGHCCIKLDSDFAAREGGEKASSPVTCLCV